ncbi:MAG: hypothetical protein ACRES7_07680 [Gammaproteobacteria bacterium]
MSYLLCISNEGYPASLKPRKLYEQLPDPEAEALGLVRVRAESDEDYLFPADHFAKVKQMLERATSQEQTFLH